jgi:hypothetical protein
MSQITKYKGVADQINKACEEKGCPPAFDIQLSPTSESDSIHIRASEQYRFEGFGAVLGLPPKMSFWVHYLLEDGKTIEIGRFLVPIAFSDFRKI